MSLQDRISDLSKGLQNASPSELTSEESQTLSLKVIDRPLPFSGISGDPVTIFRTRDRCVCSVIAADAEHPHCQDYRNWIYNPLKDTVFKEGGNHRSEIEKNMDKRGPNGICVLEPTLDAKPKADKHIRAVGLREEARREKIKQFQEKGWIVPSQSHWVSRKFLVPKPGTNKWRLVIDNRYVNTLLRGCEFPLLVIEDLFVKQAGSQLWSLLNLEDGFQQMPLSECSRQYTAFCIPFGVFEWRVLPMGVKVGPQAFQRIVSDCLKSLQPHTHIYINDLLTGTRPKLCGKGKMLDSKEYLEDHFHNVVKLFEKVEACHLKVRFEKCHLFMERITYCGHVLHAGMRNPAPSKVDDVRNWPKPKTPKQMKGFIGVVNWYSIYIRNFSNIAAPLMTLLQGKYERVPGVDGRKGRCRVPRERNCIQWTPEIESAFVQLKEALSAECELYIPSPDGEYPIHVDACDHGVGAVLEQQNPEGEWKPCPLFSRKLEGKDGNGQRALTTRKQETYAVVPCLLKFKSWIGGRKVTVYTDHKSLESWYKEDLCSLSGPLGRRGRWHDFLSRYHVEVVYKPGKDNTVADWLSRWAYPARLADDTNFHGSYAD